MKKTLNVLCGIVVFFLVLNGQGYASNKYALVIGNADYEDSPLRNPVYDASDMAYTLMRVGFKTFSYFNTTHEEMERAVRKFASSLQPGDVALFYFSGHGVQVEGNNYLLPVKARIRDEYAVKYSAMNAQFVLDALKHAKTRVNIIILDACRNNPFKGFRSMSEGLAPLSAPAGTLIAYATAPGTVAYDGNERNSPYTKYLLQKMMIPGLKIEELLKQVRIAVMADTEKQTPWEASSLTGDFYFIPPAPPTARPQIIMTPTPRSTATSKPRPTATPRPTPRPTVTPRPTATPTPRPTATPRPRPTPRPTSTPTPKPKKSYRPRVH